MGMERPLQTHFSEFLSFCRMMYREARHRWGLLNPYCPPNCHHSFPRSFSLAPGLDFILCFRPGPEAFGLPGLEACLPHGLRKEVPLLCFPQVEFSPTLQTLASVVNDIGSHLFSTISVFQHLPEILIKRKFQRDPIHVIVGEWAMGGGHHTQAQ